MYTYIYIYIYIIGFGLVDLDTENIMTRSSRGKRVNNEGEDVEIIIDDPDLILDDESEDENGIVDEDADIFNDDKGDDEDDEVEGKDYARMYTNKRTKYVHEDAKFNFNDEVNAAYKDGENSQDYEATIINIKKTNDLGYMYHVVAKDRSKWLGRRDRHYR